MASANATMGGFFNKSELARKGVVQISQNRRGSFTVNLILLVSNFEGPNVSVINRKCPYEMGVFMWMSRIKFDHSKWTDILPFLVFI